MQMRPRSFGEILDGAFQIYRRHAAALALTTLAPYGVRALLSIVFLGRIYAPGGKVSPALGLAIVPVWVAGVCAVVLTWGALAWQSSEAWLGSPVTVADGYRTGLRSFFRLLGTLFAGGALLYLSMIPVMLLAVLLMLPVMMAGGAGSAVQGTAAVVTGVVMMVGMAFAVVLVGGWLACAIPATVIEGLGPFRALGRSFELARGAVLRSGALLLVAGLIVVLPILGLMLLTGQLTALFTAPGTPPSLSTLLAQQLGGLAASAFTTPFLLSVLTVLYYDRRVRREALDVQLAAHDLDAPPALPC